MSNKAQREYADVLQSGMFFEWFPQLSGDYERDEEEWLKIYEELTKLRNK